MIMKVYLDNSATTAVDSRVLKEMLPYFDRIYGNPSSLHAFGREALKAVDEARKTIADCLNAKPSEIYITSGGTESDNWALKGAVRASKNKVKHIITSKIEHPAILETCRELEKDGVRVTYVGVDKDGRVSVEEIKNAVTDDTVLISIMFANNEMGAIQPIAEIGAFAREEGILFHTDAVQAIDSQEIDVDKLNLDMLSLSAHKFHGPKGIGLLYVRSGVKIDRLIAGGHQERAKRGGTTDTPLIVGMAKAMEISKAERAENNLRIARLRDRLIDRALAEIPYCYLNGGREHRLPNNANLSFGFIEGESILFTLDLEGIAVSSGSACSSGSLEPSHVILALGTPVELAHSSIRFSLGRETTEEEIDYTVEVLKKTVERLRAISPLFNMEKGTGSYV
ncbi:MAG TPA: cysteine desulfurase NifS [Candidatus Stercoripulliclostridium merdipullorum]|uniref:Cysteine desulfurase IscS n=1 Tax=Candidatus Stercoripulliclostridium merdipullorum TaxID=2840952 RepID=A0A9D1NCF7_9FIRM|nr:cysteine desulfurase NifS [Candidatus Stercoripulliclostridium merdipullorum]